MPPWHTQGDIYLCYCSICFVKLLSSNPSYFCVLLMFYKEIQTCSLCCYVSLITQKYLVCMDIHTVRVAYVLFMWDPYSWIRFLLTFFFCLYDSLKIFPNIFNNNNKFFATSDLRTLLKELFVIPLQSVVFHLVRRVRKLSNGCYLVMHANLSLHGII
jgi:hypothetical protein